MFFPNLAIELPENIGINEHAIKLEDYKQLSYRPIYSLGPVELKTLKTYIKIYLKSEFIQTFKSFAEAPILFGKKQNGSFCLCFNYCGFNNLTIKNQYLLLLINKSLNRLV